jgi:hypothetical protein
VAGLPSAARPTAKGALTAGRASNPPTSSTTQKLEFKGKTLARGATAIPAGASRPLKLKLTQAGRKALKRKRKIAATLVVSARGTDGKVAEIRRRLALRRR